MGLPHNAWSRPPLHCVFLASCYGGVGIVWHLQAACSCMTVMTVLFCMHSKLSGHCRVAPLALVPLGCVTVCTRCVHSHFHLLRMCVPVVVSHVVKLTPAAICALRDGGTVFVVRPLEGGFDELM